MERFFELRHHPRAPMIGVGGFLLLVCLSIMLGAHSFFAFFSFEGLLIVGGGVIAVAYMSYEAADVRRALEAVRGLMKERTKTQEDLSRDMMAIIYCAQLLKEKGMRSLEAIIAKSGLTDPFVKYGFNMAVSEYEPEEVRAMMETAAEASFERDIKPVDILHAMAGHAPAFGMVGTLVGMVAMLANMNGDMSNVGSTLAISFLSTLYGVLFARLLYLPAACKLRQEVEHRRFRNYLITEGMVLLASNKTPMFIQDRLNSFLRPEAHNYLNILEAPARPSPLRMAARAA